EKRTIHDRTRGRLSLQSSEQDSAQLLVDADVHSIESIEAAINVLSKNGSKVQAHVFTQPGRNKNKKWQKLLQRPHVHFHPVPRRTLGEATDSAVQERLQLQRSTSTGCIALFTSDFGFADVLVQMMEDGKTVLVLIPSSCRAVIRQFRSIGVPLLELKLELVRRPKVRALLHQDGSGHVRLTGALRAPLDNSRDVEFCEEFLRALGYVCKNNREHLSHATAKFWLANGLGSLIVYPPVCAVKAVCAVAKSYSGRRWVERGDTGEAAFLLPKPAPGKPSNTQLKIYGSTEARRVFKGGGPFVLPDSENLVPKVLRRLGYVDDSLNSDLAEARMVFVNAPDNRYALRKQGLLPVLTTAGSHVDNILREAFLSHLSSGHWRFRPRMIKCGNFSAERVIRPLTLQQNPMYSRLWPGIPAGTICLLCRHITDECFRFCTPGTPTHQRQDWWNATSEPGR
ncbi:ANKRD50, partial [Symbiodinium necroappetens]